MMGDFKESCFHAALLPRPRFLYLAKGWQWHVLQGLQKERKPYYLMLWISYNVFIAVVDIVGSNSVWTTYLPWLNTDVFPLPRFPLFPTFPVFCVCVSSECRGTGVGIVPGITWKSDHKEFQISCSASHLSLISRIANRLERFCSAKVLHDLFPYIWYRGGCHYLVLNVFLLGNKGYKTETSFITEV